MADTIQDPVPTPPVPPVDTPNTPDAGNGNPPKKPPTEVAN